VAVGIAAVCVRLGFWQLSRLEERRTTNATIAAGLARPVDTIDAASADAEPSYRRVSAAGRYLTRHELLLYGRAFDGSPGDHVLTPLRLDGGGTVLVDRGWIPFRADRTVPVAEALPPEGVVAVEGILLPPEDAPAFPEGEAGSVVDAANVAQIANATGLDLIPVVLLLQTQEPANTGDLPVPAPLPPRDEGPHLSYAIQWFSFAAIAILGYVLLARRGRRPVTASAPEDPV
jgi:surfeit locus 1 family protein